jgi:hypothetical protein
MILNGSFKDSVGAVWSSRKCLQRALLAKRMGMEEAGKVEKKFMRAASSAFLRTWRERMSKVRTTRQLTCGSPRPCRFYGLPP